MIHKNELINQVAATVELPQRKVENVVTLYFKLIGDALKCNEKIHVSNFGTFENKIRFPMKKYVPSQKKYIQVPLKKTPHFTPSKMLNEKVNEC